MKSHYFGEQALCPPACLKNWQAVRLLYNFCVLKIRPATASDHDAIWQIFHEVIAAGETYPLDPNISREHALAYWLQSNAHVYVADNNGEIIGSYTLHPNQSGNGAHVANAAFVVARDVRGQGTGRAMGEHCLKEARRFGFRAMQFNFVVSTNEGALKLWQDLGMKIAGHCPVHFGIHGRERWMFT